MVACNILFELVSSFVRLILILLLIIIIYRLAITNNNTHSTIYLARAYRVLQRRTVFLQVLLHKLNAVYTIVRLYLSHVRRTYKSVYLMLLLMVSVTWILF